MSTFNGRQVAYKVWLSNLLSGQFFNSPGEYEPNVVEVDDLKISRVNLIGMVVDVFSKNDGKYYSLSVDDSSSSIDIKFWGEDTLGLKDIQVGDSVLIIGKVRRYNDAIYIAPEIVKRLNSPAWLKFRKLELFSIYGEAKKFEVKSFSDANNLEQEAETGEDNLDLREKILFSIEKLDHGEGIDLNALENDLKVKAERIKTILLGLLTEGEVFELTPRKYRVMP